MCIIFNIHLSLFSFHSSVHNFGELGCSPFKKLLIDDDDDVGPCTVHTLCWNPVCAVQNAYALQTWMLCNPSRFIMFPNDEDDDGEDEVDQSVANTKIDPRTFYSMYT